MNDRVFIGIDTGPQKSAKVAIKGDKVLYGYEVENHPLMNDLMSDYSESVLAIEKFQGRGTICTQDCYDSDWWCGVFVASWRGDSSPVLIYRSEVKSYLCGTTAANDSNVRQAIIDRYPRTGGGKTPQVGTKEQPGPLYGISNHMWAALGVALTAQAGEYGRCWLKI